MKKILIAFFVSAAAGMLVANAMDDTKDVSPASAVGTNPHPGAGSIDLDDVVTGIEMDAGGGYSPGLLASIDDVTNANLDAVRTAAIEAAYAQTGVGVAAWSIIVGPPVVQNGLETVEVKLEPVGLTLNGQLAALTNGELIETWAFDAGQGTFTCQVRNVDDQAFFVVD